MITVVLLKPKTPENIGFICRAMANFGLDSLIIIAPECNPLDEQALRVAMHSKEILTKAKVLPYSSFSKLKDDFDVVAGTTSLLGTDYNISRTPLTVKEFSKKTSSENTALVFGNEASGLTNKEIGSCDLVVTIPTSENYAAMNISHAASIFFYEIYEQKNLKKIGSHIKKASRKEKDIMLEKIDAIIDSIEFSTEEKKQTQLKAWKSFIEKSFISKRESQALLGLLKKVNDRLSNS